MFNKGDYLVILKDDADTNNWKDFILKQLKDDNSIMPEVTPSGYDNSEEYLSYAKFAENDLWRYATDNEIEEYQLVGKPFNVIEFNNFTLPKNWHIVVTEENAEDVLKWRFENSYSSKDNQTFLNNIVGICEEEFGYFKGHNLKTDIIGDTYNFGIEITFNQFVRYVLNKKIHSNFLIKFLDKYGIK